ncbi:hypothetical protein [Leptolyngbya sp. O-77]|uniref:hypothetical protein n=1 Tax=Leptolyngbya sp. O-77 TaxID=1080068 RepID=UPI0012E37DA4|nr:hypothetical protein [Leptolyngbya sp. O-77]
MNTVNCMRGRSPFISQHQNLSAIALIWQHPDLWAIAPRYLFEPQTADPSLSPLNVGILPESCWECSG